MMHNLLCSLVLKLQLQYSFTDGSEVHAAYRKNGVVIQCDMIKCAYHHVVYRCILYHTITAYRIVNTNLINAIILCYNDKWLECL